MFNDRSSLLAYLATRRSGKARDMVAPGPDTAELRDIIALALRTRSRVSLEFTGRALVNIIRNDARANNVDVPVFARPDSGTGPQGGLAMTIRQTTLGLAFSVSEVAGGTFRGDIDADFYGGQQPSSGGRTFPLVRLRTARGALEWAHGALMIGQEQPLITGLDPVSRRTIWEEVEKLNDEGTTVFLTTQYLEEADQLADRVGIIDAGKLVAEGTPGSLKAEVGRPHLEVRVSGDGAHAEEVVARFGKPLPAKDGAILVELERGAAEVAPVVRALDEAGLAVESLDLVQPTLDDVFVAKTGYHLEADGEEEGGEMRDASVPPPAEYHPTEPAA